MKTITILNMNIRSNIHDDVEKDYFEINLLHEKDKKEVTIDVHSNNIYVYTCITSMGYLLPLMGEEDLECVVVRREDEDTYKIEYHYYYGLGYVETFNKDNFNEKKGGVVR